MLDAVDLACWVEVELISQVGGHKYAGNLVFHRPSYNAADDATGDGADANEYADAEAPGIHVPAADASETGAAPAAAMTSTGWFGRVRPQHVLTVVEKTIRRGEILQPLVRGAPGTRMKVSGSESQWYACIAKQKVKNTRAARARAHRSEKACTSQRSTCPRPEELRRRRGLQRPQTATEALRLTY